MLRTVKSIFEKTAFVQLTGLLAFAAPSHTDPGAKTAMTSNWRAHATVSFECDKRPACGARMVVTNHPHALKQFGLLPLAEVIEPAIRHAARGFLVSPYLANAIEQVAPDLVADAVLGPLLVPHGTPLRAGMRLV